MPRTVPVLTAEQWELLEQAERPFYHGQHGTHGYTSVIPRDEGTLAAALWEHAHEQVEAAHDYDEWDTRTDEETSRRVAAAIAVLSFGTDFLT